MRREEEALEAVRAHKQRADARDAERSTACTLEAMCDAMISVARPRSRIRDARELDRIELDGSNAADDELSDELRMYEKRSTTPSSIARKSTKDGELGQHTLPDEPEVGSCSVGKRDDDEPAGVERDDAEPVEGGAMVTPDEGVRGVERARALLAFLVSRLAQIDKEEADDVPPPPPTTAQRPAAAATLPSALPSAPLSQAPLQVAQRMLQYCYRDLVSKASGGANANGAVNVDGARTWMAPPRRLRPAVLLVKTTCASDPRASPDALVPSSLKVAFSSKAHVQLLLRVAIMHATSLSLERSVLKRTSSSSLGPSLSNAADGSVSAPSPMPSHGFRPSFGSRTSDLDKTRLARTLSLLLSLLDAITITRGFPYAMFEVASASNSPVKAIASPTKTVAAVASTASTINNAPPPLPPPPASPPPLPALLPPASAPRRVLPATQPGQVLQPSVNAAAAPVNAAAASTANAARHHRRHAPRCCDRPGRHRSGRCADCPVCLRRLLEAGGGDDGARLRDAETEMASRGADGAEIEMTPQIEKQVIEAYCAVHLLTSSKSKRTTNLSQMISPLEDP